MIKTFNALRPRIASPAWRRTILRIVLVTVAAAILLEAGLRLLGLGSPLLFEVDSHYGSFPKPNQSLHRFFVDIATNEFGMRSKSIPPLKRADEYRILIVGDSVSFGTTYVDQKDILSEKISAKMNDGRRGLVTVMNASSPGWAPSNELGFIRARGIFKADMVVLVYNTKDLTQDFSPYRDSPATPQRKPGTAISELWSRYVRPRLPIASAPVIDSGSTEFDGYPSETNEHAVLETIRATRNYVVDQGAQFVVMYTPAFTRDVLSRQSDWDHALSNLKQWTLGENVPFLDMTTAIAHRSLAALYFDGIHLRARGDDLFAQAFVNWYEARPGSGARQQQMDTP